MARRGQRPVKVSEDTSIAIPAVLAAATVLLCSTVLPALAGPFIDPEYKAARYGRTFARVDRFFPSTRMCSDCGLITNKMALNVRAWTCPCGSTHDRDINAAINVLAAGQAESRNDRGAQVRPGPSRHRATKR